MLLTDEGIEYAFILVKEKFDLELLNKLRRDGLITSPGASFEASQKQEIDSLTASSVFEFI